MLRRVGSSPRECFAVSFVSVDAVQLDWINDR